MQIHTSDLNILVAEDDPDTGFMYLKLLEGRGHRVTLARDGKECLFMYRKAIDDAAFTSLLKRKERFGFQPFDAVILDFKMPVMNGLEVAKEIAVISPRQRIIMVSSYDSFFFEEAKQNFNLSLEILSKPFSVVKLSSLLENP